MGFTDGPTRWDPFVGHTSAVGSVAFSPDGKEIMAGTYGGAVYVRSIDGRQAFDGHAGRITSTIISPGAILSASMDDDTVRFWDPESHLPMDLSLIGDTTGIVAMSMSPDGSRIAAASMSDTISLWNSATRQLVSPPMRSPIISIPRIFARQRTAHSGVYGRNHLHMECGGRVARWRSSTCLARPHGRVLRPDARLAQGHRAERL